MGWLFGLAVVLAALVLVMLLLGISFAALEKSGKANTHSVKANWLFAASELKALAPAPSELRALAPLETSGKADPHYIKADALFTAAERQFLAALDKAVGNHYRVFGKVRVADVVKVAPTSDTSLWQRAFNKINAKHFDFVLCRADNLSVVAVIELNDSSHRRRKRQERDEFLTRVCAQAGLPLVPVRVRSSYATNNLRGELARALGLPVQPQSAGM